MLFKLSVLDPSPVFEGRSARVALQDTLALAQAADKMGLESVWVQEHHNAASFAGTAPEVTIAAIAARTERINVGAGGVMLPNYSPLKVAEQFATLEALHPGRIQLGLGRATGADPRASAALLGPGANEFPNMLRLLMDWLLDASGEEALQSHHPAHGIRANPRGQRPDMWMLCSSAPSAAFAGQMGLKLAYADFLSPGGAKAALAAYHQTFTPSRFTETPYAAIGLVALAAETNAEAERLAATARAWNIRRAAGQFSLFQSAEVAAAELARAPAAALEAVKARGMVGAASDVAQRLTMLANDTGAEELFLLTLTDTIESRIRSYELLYRHITEG